MKQSGVGSPGIAHLVSDRRSGDGKVLKKFLKQNAATPLEQLQQEIRGLMMLDHPHILKLFEYYEDEYNIVLVTEAAVGGDLSQVIQKLHRSGYLVGERWSAAVTQQVLEAIAYCHELQIMHKDLKAENIMLLNIFDFETYPHAVITDLGFAGMFQATSEDGAHGVVAGGTPVAMAPEVWRAYMGLGNFGFKSDIYSLGVVLFQLLTGTLPFQCSSGEPVEWIRLITSGPPADLLETYCSNLARKLVVKMLAYDPIRRPTARHALRNKWFFQL
jgi:serine/threonine protein kinase